MRPPLMVMPSNNSDAIIHYWAGRYPGRIGWLLGPSGMQKTKLREWIPFALDNDAFAAWTKGTPWNESMWLSMLDTLRHDTDFTPRWVLVPDVVADRDATLRKWDKYSGIAEQFGWPLAMAVQDGMTPEDVPEGCVIFVGGTTKWKWDSVEMWASTNHRVHVGRVNEVSKLVLCEKLGVESVDGTGWMRGTGGGRQAKALADWLEGGSTKELQNEDFTICSGTTGVACQNTGRSFIGIERDDKYFAIACQRMNVEIEM